MLRFRSTIHHRGAPPARAAPATTSHPTPLSIAVQAIASRPAIGASIAVAAGGSLQRRPSLPPLTTTSSAITHRRRGGRRAAAAAQRADGDPVPVPAATFSPVSSADKLRADAEHIGQAIAQWLDEEWAPLPEHRALGQAVADAYIRQRSSGDQGTDDDVASVLLGMGSDLMASFDFGPTFTSGFEVANKAIELAMRRDGMEVCGCDGGQG